MNTDDEMMTEDFSQDIKIAIKNLKVAKKYDKIGSARWDSIVKAQLESAMYKIKYHLEAY